MSERVGLSSGIGWDWHVGRDLIHTTKTQSLGNMVYAAIGALEGDVRFIVTALSLLQTKWTDKTVYRPSTGHRTLPGVRTKWLDVHELTIIAPKERIIRQYKRTMSTGAKRRRHDVMGHWAYRHGLGLKDCVHDYEQTEKGWEVCRHCASTRWWKPPHKRGDEKIGVVSKTYRVEAP